jgi:hypothetical protein
LLSALTVSPLALPVVFAFVGLRAPRQRPPQSRPDAGTATTSPARRPANGRTGWATHTPGLTIRQIGLRMVGDDGQGCEHRPAMRNPQAVRYSVKNTESPTGG